MGEKNKKNNGEEQQKEGGENKKKENGGGKNNAAVVLKADLHCEGCVSKVLKCIRSFDGVETANIGDGKITVIGKVDPAKLRERVEKKTHKKIEVISPQLKKEENSKDNAKGKENNGNDNAKQEKKESKEKNSKEKSVEKKSKEKEMPVTTAVLKVQLHCEGCTQKIYKIVTKTKGYRDVKIDKVQELVTVTGAIDMKALAEALKKHLKREVHILPPKKEAEKKENVGGEKAKSGGEKGKNGGDKGKNGGGGGGGGGNGGEKAAGGDKVEGNRMQFQVGYPYPFMYEPGVVMDQFHYNPHAYGPYHAPQLFSDENPNACSVM